MMVPIPCPDAEPGCLVAHTQICPDCKGTGVHGGSKIVDQVQRLLPEIVAERLRQIEKFPDCEHLPDGTGGGARETWERIAKNGCDRAMREGRLTHTDVFDEETAEVMAATNPVELRKELIQTIAVACKWVADLDSR
jgi:hypothetical protein